MNHTQAIAELKQMIQGQEQPEYSHAIWYRRLEALEHAVECIKTVQSQDVANGIDEP